MEVEASASTHAGKAGRTKPEPDPERIDRWIASPDFEWKGEARYAVERSGVLSLVRGDVFGQYEAGSRWQPAAGGSFTPHVRGSRRSFQARLSRSA